MKLDWEHWWYKLAKTVVGGVAASGLAWLGTAAGHAISASIDVLSIKQLGFVLGTSILYNLFFALKENPVPDDMEAEPVKINNQN